MLDDVRIAFIGGGVMCEAMVNSLINGLRCRVTISQLPSLLLSAARVLAEGYGVARYGQQFRGGAAGPHC